jgi:hypothetical protein
MKRLRFLGLVCAFVVIAEAGAAGAFAATKLLESRAQNFTITTPTFADHLCGVTTVFQSTWEFGQFSTVRWDDGHSLLSFAFRDYIADAATGVVLATTTASHAETEGPGSLPLTFEHNVAATCTPESPMPGHEITIVSGGTVNENGSLTEMHIKEVIG